MRVLVAISSCQGFEDSGLNTPMRDTWLTGTDYKFFHGYQSKGKEDIITLSVDDSMGGLTEKAKAKARWAYDQGYDYIFSCFPDTYAVPSRLWTSGFERYDYLGREHQHPGGAPYCQGGPGYFLSRKAMHAVFSATTSYLNDDCWVGDVLHAAGITRGDSRDFQHLGPGPLRTNTSITNHLSTQPGGYTRKNMYEEHKRWTDSWL